MDFEREISDLFPAHCLAGQRQVHGETPQFAFSISRLGASPGSDIFAVKTGASAQSANELGAVQLSYGGAPAAGAVAGAVGVAVGVAGTAAGG